MGRRDCIRQGLAILAMATLTPLAGLAEDTPQRSPEAARGEKVLSGMSIVGNDEAPKSLVIVPWKSSELADTLDVSRGLDAGRDPVDPDVFGRELSYYEIRVGR